MKKTAVLPSSFLTYRLSGRLFKLAAMTMGVYYVVQWSWPWLQNSLAYAGIDASMWWGWGHTFELLSTGGMIVAIAFVLAAIATMGAVARVTVVNGVSARIRFWAVVAAWLLAGVGLLTGVVTLPLSNGHGLLFSVVPVLWLAGAMVAAIVAIVLGVIIAIVVVWVLAMRHYIAVWAAIAMVVGVAGIGLLWLSYWCASMADGWGMVAGLGFVAGMGTPLGWWHMARLGDGQPVRQWPHWPSWRRVGLAAAAVGLLWLALGVGVYIWDESRITQACPAVQSVKEGVLIRQTDLYSFSLTAASDIDWNDWGQVSLEAGQYDCQLYSWQRPQWTTNVAFYSIFSFAPQLLWDSFNPDPPAVGAYFGVAVADKTTDTPQSYLAKLEQRAAEAEAKAVKTARPIPSLSKQTVEELQGVSAVRQEIWSKEGNYVRVEYWLANGSHEYTIYYTVFSSDKQDFETYLAAHQAQLESMLQSFSLKQD